MKLIQKQLLKSSREFEIINDTVYVEIKGLLKGEKITIGLSTLDPEPVVNGGELEFYSRYQGRPLLSLYIDKPSAKEFNAFVDALKQGIAGGDYSSMGSPESSRPEAPGWNVYEEPPGFDEPDLAQKSAMPESVHVGRLDEDIAMLKTYLNEADIKPFLDALEGLKQEPESEAAFQAMVDAFNGLGMNQGAVLTYSTYLKVLLSQTVW